jgi:putative inorganic carbon (HCO3(-)) transporter
VTGRWTLQQALFPLIGASAALLVMLTVVQAGPRDTRTLFTASVLALAVLSLAYVASVAHPAWLLTGGLLLATFSGHWGDLGLPAQVTPDRFVLAAGLVAVALRLPKLRERLSLGRYPVHWVIAVAALYVLGSALAAGTLFDKSAFLRIVDRVGLVPFALFIAAPLVFRTARERDILLGALVAWGGYLGLTAFFEGVGPNALVVPDYVMDPEVGIHFDRARGPFVEAVTNGLALYGCGVAAVIAVLTWREPRLRVAAGVVAGLCALGVFFTMQRSIWVGAAAATLLVLVAVPELRRFLVPAVAAGAFLIGGALVGVPGLADRASQRASDEKTVWDRENLHRTTLNMIEAKPLLGVGWARFEDETANYAEMADDIPLTLPTGLGLHNMFLGNTAELGLIGASIWALALLLGVGGAVLARGPPELRPWRIGLGAFAVCWVVAGNFSYLLAFPTLLLWAWAGVVWRGGHAMATDPPHSSPDSARRRAVR